MRFSIGEFSRISQLSIKSLRIYHEKGILIPFEVDPLTGYRNYDEPNFEVARIIRVLKQYDFTLAEIKEILERCEDDGDLAEQIQQKLVEVQKKINRYKEISRSMEQIIQLEKE